VGQHGFDFLSREDHRHAFRFFGAVGMERARVKPQHLFIQKQNGAERLCVRTGGDMLVDRSFGQKLFDLCHAHLFGMAFLVKVNKAFHPIQIPPLEGARGRSFRPFAVMLDAEQITHLVSQFGAYGFRRG